MFRVGADILNSLFLYDFFICFHVKYMLRLDEAIYVSLFFKFILSKTLRNKLWESVIFLCFHFMNILSVVAFYLHWIHYVFIYLLKPISSTKLFSCSAAIASFGLQSSLCKMYLVLLDLSMRHSFSLVSSMYGKYILVLTSFSWMSVARVYWCDWCKLWLLVILLQVLLIMLSWYSFSFNTSFTLAFSLVNSSLLVIMDYALLSKKKTKLSLELVWWWDHIDLFVIPFQ